LTSTDNNKNRIAYLCPRTNYLKVYIPVIVEQLANGFPLEPVIVIPGSNNTFWGNKNDTAATIDKLKGYDALGQVKIIEMNDEKHLLELLYKHNVKVVVEFSAATNKEISSYVLPKSKDRGVKWCVIGSNGDELRVVDFDGGKTVEQWDLITVVNDFWRRWVTEYLNEINPQKAKYAEKAISTGNPEFDQIPQLKFSRKEILDKYNLPSDKKILFLAPVADYNYPLIYRMLFFNKFVTKIINIPVLKQLFRKYVCAREEALIKNWDTIQNYTDILKKARNFADRNNAVIICKRRAKDGKLKKCEKEYIDFVFEEGSFYPFLTLELMSVSDMYIGFESYCFFEAVALEIPAINFVSPLQLYASKAGLNKVLWDKLWLANDALFKIKDVSEVYKTYIEQDWKKFCKKMEGSLIEQKQKYDNSLRKEFLKAFFGSSEFNSARRFLNAVETIL
jgi:hypothetical protein